MDNHPSGIIINPAPNFGGAINYGSAFLPAHFQGTRINDRLTAALLADLEQRGLLEDTLVLFGSEFGRMPTAQGPDGRDHNITGYPMWLAGAGVKPGFSYGSTDEYGLHATEGRMHTTDLHATLLALLGLDDVAGRAVNEIFD